MPRPIPFRGGYRVNFSDKNGIRHRRWFSETKYDDPLQACRDYVADVLGGKQRRSPVQIDWLVREYLSFAEKTQAKAPTTLETDRRRLRAFAEWCTKNNIKSATQLTTEAIRGFETYFWQGGTWYPTSGSNRTQGNRAATWNRYFNAVSTLTRWAIERGYIAVNPAAARSQFLRPEQEKPIERVYSGDELRTVFEWLDRNRKPAEACFYRLLAYTGLRPSEAVRLEWKAVDLKGRTITVSHTKNRRVRTIPIAPDLVPHLTAIKSGHRLVFSDGSGMYLHRIWWWGRLWAKALKAAGVAPGRLYDVRHTFATDLIENATPVTDVRELLGHRRIETTMRYVHSRPERLRESVSKLYKSKKGGAGEH